MSLAAPDGDGSSSSDGPRLTDSYWRRTPDLPGIGGTAGPRDVDSTEFRELADHLPTLWWIADADGYITWYNRRWHDYCGTTPEEMEGWGWQSVHDPAILPDVMARWTASIRTGAPFEMVFPLRGADGVFRPFLTRIVPMRDKAGAVRRWVGNNIEIGRQVATEQELRGARDALELAARGSAEREAFLASVLAASTDCIKVLELDGTLSFMSEGGQQVMEIGDFGAVRGCPWPDLLKDAGADQASEAIAAAREGRSSHFEMAADTYAGTPKWWSVSVSPIRGADGSVERILSVSRDLTALRDAHEQQQLLNGELAHRLKNTLSVVQAIATQTFGKTGEREALDAFVGRLTALARAHDVLTARSWSAATVRQIATEVLSTFHGERISLSGPDVEIGARAALALSLLLHELATNATKHGALSGATGHVSLDWTLTGEGPDRRLRMIWAERGGPPAREPTRRGFGSRIIRMGLTGSGGTDADYGEHGLTLTADASLEQLQQA